MKTMKKYFITLFVALLGLASCDQKWLEIEQKGVVDESEYYSTDADALAAVTVVYSKWSGAWFSDFFLKNMISDDSYCGGGGRGDNANYEQINEYRFATNNTTISDPYSSYYQIIYYANVLLSKFSQGESAAKNRCIAEAKTARAWAHMQLAMLWGTPPIVDHVFNGSSEYQQPNSTKEALWAFIIKDLADAATVLPSKSSLTAQEARLTKEAALAFKGKAEVMSGNMAAAKVTLKQVINSGLYGLVDGSVLEDLFTGEYDLCKESIFESNIVYNPANVWIGGGLYQLMMGWRTDALNGYPSGAYNTGWGFFNPQEAFIQAFKANEEGSARYKAWVRSWDDALTMGVTGLAKNYLYGSVGYFDWKWHVDPDDVPVDGYGFSYMRNPRWMRYAEVLLLYAEACAVEGDSDGSGLRALNDIQNRAGAPTTTLTLDNVKREKRFEMWLEGTRFIDVVRWGEVTSSALPTQGSYVPLFKGKNADGSYNIDRTTYQNNSYGFKKDKHELLPFPDAETISNQRIKQNLGW